MEGPVNILGFNLLDGYVIAGTNRALQSFVPHVACRVRRKSVE
jgi:hypothetical protein